MVGGLSCRALPVRAALADAANNVVELTIVYIHTKY